ncbi:MAG: hypothetical protein KFF50_11125, partial [Desulfatitalea sp.]|nr:hypothetical protein [Desulfatitalea sp.]
TKTPLRTQRPTPAAGSTSYPAKKRWPISCPVHLSSMNLHVIALAAAHAQVVFYQGMAYNRI